MGHRCTPPRTENYLPNPCQPHRLPPGVLPVRWPGGQPQPPAGPPLPHTGKDPGPAGTGGTGGSRAHPAPTSQNHPGPGGPSAGGGRGGEGGGEGSCGHLRHGGARRV